MTNGTEARPHAGVQTPDKILEAFLGSQIKRTAESYRYDMKSFAGWLAWKDIHAWDVTHAIGSTYVTDLKNTPSPSTLKPLAAATIARRISTVSSFYEFAVESDCLHKNPFLRVKRPKRPNESSRTSISEAEFVALLKAARRYSPAADALICLLGLNGMRIAEVLGIKAGDITEAEFDGQLLPVVKILRKGGKTQSLPLSPRTDMAVKHWLDVTELDDDDLLFSYDRHQANRVVKVCGAKVGIPEDLLSPHVLRHSFTTMALDHGVPPHEVQAALGHASLATTTRYAHAKGMTSNPTFALSKILAA